MRMEREEGRKEEPLPSMRDFNLRLAWEEAVVQIATANTATVSALFRL